MSHDIPDVTIIVDFNLGILGEHGWVLMHYLEGMYANEMRGYYDTIFSNVAEDYPDANDATRDAIENEICDLFEEHKVTIINNVFSYLVRWFKQGYRIDEIVALSRIETRFKLSMEIWE